MEQIEKGEVTYVPQNHDEATHVGMIEKEFGNIDWNKSAVEIERLIRGLNPWPSAFTKIEDKERGVRNLSIRVKGEKVNNINKFGYNK